MIEQANVIPLINETAQYKSYSVTINNIALRPQDIMDLQINFNQVIRGRMSFVDTLNVVEFAPITAATIQIEYTDASGVSFESAFVVTEVQSTRMKDNNINVIIKFEDIRTNILTNSYISRAFSGKTMLQMLELIFDEIGIPALFYHYNGDYIYDHFVFPANISLLDFIMKQITYSNIRMYTDRNDISFISRDVYNFNNLDNPTEPIFTVARDESKPYWNILEYDAKVANNNELKKAAKANMHKTEASALKYDPESVSIETVYESQTINKYMGMGTKTTLPEIVQTLGYKEISHLFHNEINGADEDYRDIINKSQTVTIAIQGLNITRLFTKVEIRLPRPASVQTNEPDEVYSGVFVVTGVVDKIIAGNFMQFLTLSSSDYGSGSENMWKS